MMWIIPGWHLTQTHYNWTLDSTRRIWQPPEVLRFCIRVIRAIRGEFLFLVQSSRLLFLAEFLEARIIPERIEHRIEPEQRGSNRTAIRYLQQPLENGNRVIGIP